MPTTAVLLTASLAAHAQARQARKNGHSDESLVHLREAQRQRLRAAEQDPTFTDPAWDGRHQEFLEFYTRQLSAEMAAARLTRHEARQLRQDRPERVR